MKRYSVETVTEAAVRYFYIQDCETMEMELLPSRYLVHKVKSNRSPNTVKRAAFALCVKGLCPHDPLYTDRVGHCDLPVRQDPQAPKLGFFRLHKKIEPEHVFQIRITGSIPGVLSVIFSFMPACLDPVEEPHKVFMLLVIGQLADLGKFHLLFREVFQVITQGEGRPFYRVW